MGLFQFLLPSAFQRRRVMTPFLGITWSHSPITWALGTPTSANNQGLSTLSNTITDSTQVAQVTAGINAWATVSGVLLSLIGSPASADIQIGYADVTGELGLIGEALWNYNPGTNKFNFSLIRLQDGPP